MVEEPLEVERAQFVHRVDCITCGSSQTGILSEGSYNDDPFHAYLANSPFGVDPMPALRDARWELRKCDRCGTLYHGFVLDEVWIDKCYSEWVTAEAMAEFELQRFGKSFDQDFAAAIPRYKHVLRLERLTRAIRGKDKLRVLDFGAGYGRFVQMCLASDIDACGFDFAAPRRTNAEVRISSSLDDFSGQFHAVTMFEVLEHLVDPGAVLAQLAERMVTGGILILETPDCTGVQGLGTLRECRLISPIQHINAFTADSLTRIAAQHGFTRIGRPFVTATTDPVRAAKDFARKLLGVGERSTQQYFRKN